MNEPGILSDRAQQAKLKKAEQRLAAMDAADLRDVLKTEGGRRFYYRVVFLLAGLETASIDVELPLRMAFLEGRRNVAGVLRDEALEVCPDLWLRMIEERIAFVEQKRKREFLEQRGSMESTA